jgi:hypothetical protein
VFNTPNGQSRPGYLKMGWQEVGRLPVGIRIARLAAPVRLVRARVPADRWSSPTDVATAAADAFADAGPLEALLASRPPEPRLATVRTAAFYRWRYGGDLLPYRVVAAEGLEGGFVVFRLRRRGAAVEAAIGDVVVPGGDRRRARELLARTRAVVPADYLIALGDRLPGFVPFPRQGPILTWRHVRAEPSARPGPADLAVTLGDIELF